MASDLILTTAQAQAVYSAMCALKSVGAKLDTEVPVGSAGSGMIARVYEAHSGAVAVCAGRSDPVEHYVDQAAFAAAYGLRQPPDAAPLLEALQAALAYNDSVMSADGSGQFSWGPIARAAIAQATA